MELEPDTSLIHGSDSAAWVAFSENSSEVHHTLPQNVLLVQGGLNLVLGPSQDNREATPRNQAA